MGSSGYVMKSNGTVRNSSQATVFTMQDFQIDSDIGAGVQSILVSGRIIDATSGYVGVNTSSRFTFFLPGTTIWSGSFAMTGAGPTATVTYTDGIPSAVIN